MYMVYPPMSEYGVITASPRENERLQALLDKGINLVVIEESLLTDVNSKLQWRWSELKIWALVIHFEHTGILYGDK